MKIAVKNSDGIKTSIDDKLQFYYETDDFYDFGLNNALNVTTVDNAQLFFNHKRIDYKKYRKILQDIASTNYEMLNADEQYVICIHKATDELIVFDKLGSQSSYYMNLFNQNSIECRYNRFSYAKAVILSNISYQNRFGVLGFLNSTKLVENYIEHGIAGTNDGDPIAGLLDYVESTSSFLGTGLSSINFSMIGGITKSEMINKIVECLRNGNYT